MTQYFCATERRRDEVRRVNFLNGIDFVEVAIADQRTLLVHFIHPVAGLTKNNFRIVGGVRVTDVQVQTLVGTVGDVVTLKTDRSGDFSTYTLQLVTSAAVSDVPSGFDPMLAAVSFSFKVNCPSDFDCAPDDECAPLNLPAPHINYLAKDYASFRKLLFDRMAVTMPAWRERNPADLGVTLVELLAYAGDQLSYYQDAVATEAYLNTARSRASVRRHARLVDYPMHDGASARTWLVFETDADRGNVAAPAVPRQTLVMAPATETQPALAFETVHAVIELRVSRNVIQFYTWSDTNCCLPAGATRATLQGSAGVLGLRKGDVLVFEEVLGAESGLPADADRTHRHVVRLADEPQERIDPLTQTAVLEIRWHDEDALPFSLCLHEFAGGVRAGVARGNVALADHGQTFVTAAAGDDLIPQEVGERPYRPVLKKAGLAQVVAFDAAAAGALSATALSRIDPRTALPALALRANGETWRPQRDLLNSDRFALEFVVETEIDSRGEARARLRFGDSVLGRQPAAGTRFVCEFRLGGGSKGNVGADAVTQLTPAFPGVKVRNPVPARGGADPEPMSQAKLYAPQAFRTQERAVTEADYAAAAQRHPDVQRAACTRRWTGMFHTMFITVDRRGGKPVTAEFEQDLRRFLERFRMAGYDLEIDGPRYVALDVALDVCVLPGYLRSIVKQGLLDAFGTRELADGSRGFFHPDNYTFGQAVYLSQIIARAMQVTGVQSVHVSADGFKRFGQAPHGELDAGYVAIHRLEIARVDNNPSLPENGRIDFVLKGACNTMADESGRCDCCKTGVAEPRLNNAPGLGTLACRLSGYGGFLRRMLAQLSRESIEDAPNVLRYPLAKMATRSTDDPAIALIDGWAVVGDVLTFYQERIANEGFLRTATERRSILELAFLIGYQLNPGVAANAHLAFQVDDAVGAPGSAIVLKGMRVQSVPGQGELPQPFETSETITARVEWNALRPRQMRPQELAISNGKLVMLGISVGLGDDASGVDSAVVHPLDFDLPVPSSGEVKTAEVNTIYVSGTNSGIKVGDVVLLVGKKNAADATEQTLPKVVRAVDAEDALNRTRVEFEGPVVKPLGYGAKLNQVTAISLQAVSLNASSANAIAGATFSEQALGAFGAVQGWGMQSLVSYYLQAFTLIAPKAKLPPAAPGAFAMRTRLGFFAHNAPALIAGAGNTGMQSHDLASKSIWRTGDADCYLERAVSGISDNSWMVLDLKKQLAAFRVTTAHDASLAEYGLSGKATGLVLNAGTVKDEKYKVRETTGLVQSERLALAQLPIEAPIGKGTSEELQLTLERTVLNLRPGQFLALTGERADLPGVKASEIVTVKEIHHSGGFTTLFFESPGLTLCYIRDTVVLNANVAPATHGETVAEVLGSGDGAASFQRFTLKRPPLTYTASSSESGVQNSLQVRVDRLLWAEAAQQIDQGPSSESYIVRIADDGKASVIFGDGEHGARLPSGVENVTATYRTGIGTPGMVGADRITLMTMRPLGIRGVSNPKAASGAADPESRDSARANAPLTVLAMGRIVSLRDAEDFARAFAGIGKTHAALVWAAGTRWVHVTVAASVAAPASDGAASVLPDYRVDLGSPLGKNLTAAIETFKEPSMRLRLDTYQPLYFDVGAKVSIDPRHEWSDVERGIRTALVSAFSFDERRFAQSVSLAEVVRVLHSVAGVVFVDVDTLRRFDQTSPDLPAGGVLRATGVQWQENEAEPGTLAQLLLINPFGIALVRV